MALYDGFFDATQNEETGEYDRAYGSGDFTGYFANVIGSGVCVHNNPDSFKVRIEDGKAVVSSGYLFIKGYWLKNSADYAIDIPSTGSCAIVAHLNLGARRIELDAQSVAQTYPDALVLAIISQEAAEDTRHNKDICGVIDTAGELSQKVDWAMNYIETEIDSRFEEIEQDIAGQEEKLDKKIEDVGAVIDEIKPIPVGTIKFSANLNMGEEWLECDGQFIQKSDYPELAALLLDMPSSENDTEEINFYWTQGTIQGNIQWANLYYCKDKFITFVSEGTNSAYSNDGINWTLMNMPQSGHWNGVAYGIGKFVAVGKNVAAYSADGISWINTTMPSGFNWKSVAFGNGMFVAVSGFILGNEPTAAAYSKNGISWTTVTMPRNISWNSITYGNEKFVAVGDNAAAYSTDGISWTIIDISYNSSTATYSFDNVTYGNGIFVTIAREYRVVSAATTKAYAYSEDGVNWTTAEMPYSGYWGNLTYGNGIFVAIPVGTSDEESIFFYSEDGVNWSSGTLPSYAKWNGVAYGIGKFVAVSYKYNSSIADTAYSEPFNQARLPMLSMSNIPAYIKAKSEAEEAAT